MTLDLQTDALGKQTSFVWNVDTHTETITDANSHAWQDVYASNMLIKLSEKQALLEAQSFQDRASTLMALLEMDREGGPTTLN